MSDLKNYYIRTNVVKENFKIYFTSLTFFIISWVNFFYFILFFFALAHENYTLVIYFVDLDIYIMFKVKHHATTRHLQLSMYFTSLCMYVYLLSSSLLLTLEGTHLNALQFNYADNFRTHNFF